MIELSVRQGRWAGATLATLGAMTALMMLLSACAGKDKDGLDNANYVELPVEQLYNAAFTLLQRERYAQAARGFDEVERQHPYSIWARRSMLMSAFAYYEANKYSDAIDSADRFLSLHPGNKDAPYAYYLKAICYYEQISDVGRDQEKTLQALQALEDIARRYPTSEYARDARLKIDLTRDHLAGKEMYVGRYYLKHGQYVAAINRFKTVIETYQTTNDVPEALERLTEAYFAIGLTNEARASAAVLGYNFPDSQWYRYAYALLVQHGYGNDKGAKVQQASAQAPMTTTTARPAPAPSTPASVASAPTVQAAVPSNVAPVSAPTAQPEMASQPAPTEAAEVQPAPVVDQAPAPATESPATPEQAASARPGAHPTDMSAPTNADSEQKRRYRGYGADRDLADSWVRRLLRSLF